MKLIDKIKSVFTKVDKHSDRMTDLNAIVDSKKVIKERYSVKQCIDCKEDKVIHFNAERCLDCREIHKRSKYKRTYTYSLQNLVAIRPYDNLLCEASTKDGLMLKLKEEFDIKIPKYVITKYYAIKLKDTKQFYWYYKGLIILWKEFYNDTTLEEIFLQRITKSNSRKKTKREIPKETIDKINKIIILKSKKKNNEEIAEELKISKGYVSQVLNGNRYSDITGIKYKRKYNSYDEEGNIVFKKETKSTKIYKKGK